MQDSVAGHLSIVGTHTAMGPSTACQCSTRTSFWNSAQTTNPPFDIVAPQVLCLTKRHLFAPEGLLAAIPGTPGRVCSAAYPASCCRGRDLWRLDHRRIGPTRLPAQSGYALPDAAHDGEEGLSAIAAKEVGSLDPTAVSHDGAWRNGA